MERENPIEDINGCSEKRNKKKKKKRGIYRRGYKRKSINF